jgi:hypothetical protein
MARRASSSANPLWVGGVAVLIALAMAGGWLLYRFISDPYRTLSPLDVGVYLENANSLRGNVYKVNGVVNTQLAWAPNRGRLYSVDVDDRTDVLPLLIPSSFNGMNIQKGQRYFFKIEVTDKGVLRVQDIRKA